MCYLSQCSTNQWMSLTAHCRVPHPVRPNSLLWLQGTLILETSRDLVIPDCQSRARWTGVTTCYAEHRIPETGMVQNGLMKS